MDHLPCSSFSLINVRRPNLAGDLLSAQLELWILNADFVGDIAQDADELVLQFDFPVRRSLGYLFP
jgi:hypothetical protein